MSLIRKRKPLKYYDDPVQVARRSHANMIIFGIGIVLLGFFLKIVFI